VAWPQTPDNIPLVDPSTDRMTTPGKEGATLINSHTVAINQLQQILAGPTLQTDQARNRLTTTRNFWIRSNGDDVSKGSGIKLAGQDADGHHFLDFYPEKRGDTSPDVQMMVHKYQFSTTAPQSQLERRWRLRTTDAPAGQLIDRISVTYGSQLAQLTFNEVEVDLQGSAWVMMPLETRPDSTLDTNRMFEGFKAIHPGTGASAVLRPWVGQRRNAADTATMEWATEIVAGDNPRLQIFRTSRPDSGGAVHVVPLQLRWDGGIMIAQLSTAERSAMTGLSNGTMVYDGDLNKLVIHDGSVWRDAVGTAV
jgi:hypothetical protein